MRRVSSRKPITSSRCETLLKIFFGCFIFSNILCFYYLFDRYQQPECVRLGACRPNNNERITPREKWGQTIYFNVLFEHFRQDGDEWRLISSQNNLRDLNCSALRNFEKVRFVAAGYTKSTFKVKLDNKTISLKTVNIEGHDITSCLKEHGRFLYDCYLIAASKLLKEISILRSISHTNIVKILGYCVPVQPDIADPRHTITIFEEYGEPIEVIKLLQLSWEDRLRISLGLSRLLKHLSSFNEPIALNDFRRQQFIVIDGEPKLIDVDDVGLQEQRCSSSPCCSPYDTSNSSKCIPCINNLCRGYNEKLNIIRTGRHFIKHILPHGAPHELTVTAKKIARAFQIGSWNANNIWVQMEYLYRAFRDGLYRAKSDIHYVSGYKEYKKKSVSSNFDYRCQLTVSGYGCMTSVIDAEEAAEICWMDAKCKAFVMTNVTTWTGRRIAEFKSGFGNLLHNNYTTLYLKL
ncbi:hypothetical protein JTE90_012194 [Oedothorax gibbosus]|uniref:Protein kinase domain-containing protein n=1 Tax=Oedothorax gibbosus TaxID=931172 RepID=A0AAV6V9T5_9ARAC|nr:hypothetical protein JTE90_012194 [Oedothorax gibbosus]